MKSEVIVTQADMIEVLIKHKLHNYDEESIYSLYRHGVKGYEQYTYDEVLAEYKDVMSNECYELAEEEGF